MRFLDRSGVAAALAASLAVTALTIVSAGCGSSGDDSAAQNTGDSGSGDSSSGGEGGPNSGDGGSADGSTFPSHVRPPGTFNLGMNMPGLNYYNNAAIYADLALAISGNNGPWDSTANGSNPATLDATGGPTEAASTALPTVYPSGAYTITWDGTSAITVGVPAVGNTMTTPTTTTSGGVQHNTATLNLVQTLSPQTGAPSWFSLKASGAVSNVHIQAPASLTSASGVFLKSFIADLQPFTTLRFMDTLSTNGNLVKNWSDRTWPDGGSRAGTKQGIAYEDVIALANETGQDVWINVPVLATDDYVCRLARLFHYGEQGDKSNGACDPKAPAGAATTATLNPNAHVYVEFTNEIWNSGFQQWEDIYCMVNGAPDASGKHCDVTAPTSAIGVAALANTALPWNNSNKYEKSTQFGLILSKRVSDIFRGVFGCATGKGCQAQIPFNVQSAYAAEVEPGFAFMKTAYGSLASIDAMAVAPYFNIDNGSDTSVDAIFTDLTNNILDTPSGQIAGWINGDLAEANKYGLPLVAYEGGQGLSGGSANLVTAQSDARMYAAYGTYFNSLWDKLVGKDQLFIHYSYCGSYGSYGSWGALVNEGDPGSQKWDAMMALARQAGDANLDGVVNADDCAIVNAHFGKSPVWWLQGDFNHDGKVDAADVTALNKNISGAACTH